MFHFFRFSAFHSFTRLHFFISSSYLFSSFFSFPSSCGHEQLPSLPCKHTQNSEGSEMPVQIQFCTCLITHYPRNMWDARCKARLSQFSVWYRIRESDSPTVTQVTFLSLCKSHFDRTWDTFKEELSVGITMCLVTTVEQEDRWLPFRVLDGTHFLCDVHQSVQVKVRLILKHIPPNSQITFIFTTIRR